MLNNLNFMIFKKFNILGLILPVALLILGCSPRSSESLYSEEPLEKSLLWEISGGDLKAPSYLFGTIHLIESENFFFPQGTLSAFDKSDLVVFEIDMAEMSDMSSQFSILQKAFMPDGMSLKDLLDEGDYMVVADHFGDMGLPIFMLERIKPLFLTIMADGDMQGLDVFGSNPDAKSYEVEFNKMAEAAGKPVSGLETIDFQMALFDSIPYKIQANMLVEAIVKPTVEESDGSFDQIVEIYKQQDIEAMARMIVEDDAGFGQFTDLILENRNIAWIEPMSEMMKENSVFFAVGAGHLGGDNGVIRLLRRAGYQVEPYQN